MVNSNRAEDIAADNERSLSTLVRTIARFQGSFSLTLVCCNYASLRDAMLQKMRDRSTVEYQELVLEPATKILHQTIFNAVQEEPPKALIIVGIESVVALDDLLAGANRARDQFKQDFGFPVILWVTDAVLAKFSRSANDLKSWAPPPIQFTISPDDLINLLQQKASQAFANVDNFQLDDCKIESLRNDLSSLGKTLNPELQASWQFIGGLVAFQKNKIDLAIEHYQQSLEFWQQNHQLERQGIVCQKIAQAYNRKAELHRAKNQDSWQEARKYLQQSLESFEQSQQNDLVAKCISELGEVLQLLQAWEELQSLAIKALTMHMICGTPSQVAKDYGFLAEVALQRSEWERVCELAKLALSVLEQAGVSQQETGLYLLLWAKAQRNLSQQSEAVKNLEAAQENTQPEYDVQLYLRILEELRTIYFEQSKYLKAVNIKVEQQEIKSKYRLQAFIGAGRLQAPKQAIDIGLKSGQLQAEIIEEIVTNSGRAQDVKRIIKRIGTPACKLTIIHGQSGVGKSSIIQAGLVPALQFTTFEARDVLPVLLQSYHDWARNCGQNLKLGIEEKRKGESLSTPVDTPAAILEQLRLNESRNLLTVLIFDQFEEFFFAYQDQTTRRELYNFLAECLNQISYLKIILSLREDYLCDLLEWNRTTDVSMINNDILNKNIRYYLGNFSIPEAKVFVKTLTKRSQFYLDEDLGNALVENLAGKLGEVRPIELQIVGAQLEKRHITRLSEYQQLGNQAKLTLVEEFLAEVIADCGQENKEIAELVLYLLTDENNTRPQKTLAELAAADLGTESKKLLKLVIQIVVQSGLVLEVPPDPIERYQLVHDYLVPFIRKLQGAESLKKNQQEKAELLKINQQEKAERLRLAAENQILEKSQQKLVEAKQKAEYLLANTLGVAIILIFLGVLGLGSFLFFAGTYLIVAQEEVRVVNKQLTNARKIRQLELSSSEIWAKFKSSRVQQIEALIEIVKIGEEINNIDSITDEFLTDTPIALSQILDNIQERNRLTGHKDVVASVSFSPDGQYIATGSWDKTARLWDLKGHLVQEFRGHTDQVLSVCFSPDGQHIATGSSDKTARLWDLKGNLLQEFKGHKDLVVSVSFSPDGKRIGTASGDRTAGLWDLKGNLLQMFVGHQAEVVSIRFHPDGKRIGTASGDGTARLWDLQGNLLQEFKGHKGKVLSVSFSHDGQYIATGSRDNSARLWDLQGNLLKEFRENQDSVYDVNFSPNSIYLATASADSITRLWDLQGDLLEKFKGHQDTVLKLSFSPDNKYLVTASADKTARLWEVRSNSQQQLKTYPSEKSTVAKSGDNQGLKEMLVESCNWLHDYLENNADESEKHLCDEISPRKK
jgi:WD40 repeat protein